MVLARRTGRVIRDLFNEDFVYRFGRRGFLNTIIEYVNLLLPNWFRS